ncbi:regulatory protein RecX [Salinispora arenicola]|uniref:Regulatory protein RecX n=1 Tax=Salinispora arenicola (strain CNS-205) TaxID=391037 RepID=A8M7V6_SALAI|nr:regulatory protein RecX [Salinispora arenicola]
MTSRRARTGRGWDASPPRQPRTGDATASASRRSRADAATTSSADEAELARDICLRQLAGRPRTRVELARALTRRGISAEVATAVLDRYDEVGMIDDAAFARAWVSSRHAGRGLARRALATELRQRGVDGDVAKAALGELDDETEAETARALAERKLRATRGEPDAVFRRLVGMLARRGYAPGVAIRAAKEALAAQSAEAAEFAERIDTEALSDAGGDLDREGPLDT